MDRSNKISKERPSVQSLSRNAGGPWSFHSYTARDFSKRVHAITMLFLTSFQFSFSKLDNGNTCSCIPLDLSIICPKRRGKATGILTRTRHGPHCSSQILIEPQEMSGCPWLVHTHIPPGISSLSTLPILKKYFTSTYPTIIFHELNKNGAISVPKISASADFSSLIWELPGKRRLPA